MIDRDHTRRAVARDTANGSHGEMASLYDWDTQDDDATLLEVPRPWVPVDLTAVLDGTFVPPQPTVGSRNDGVGLFYPGKIHSVASESEGGKTWLALTAAVTEINDNRHVAYVDFEDDERGVTGRLLALGTPVDAIAKRFHYLRPDEPISKASNREDLYSLIEDVHPSLVVVDGITEAMSMHGLEIKDNSDIAVFGQTLLRPVARRGPAVVALDHVVKDREGRGRYALGGVHKLNAVDGAAYLLENRAPFGEGVTGRSGIFLAKDRPAQLRRHALPSGERSYWFADLVLTSHPDGSLVPDLWPPGTTVSSGFRPTRIMAKISRTLADNPKGLSKDAVQTMVGGNAKAVRTGLELLVSDGYVTVTKGPRGAFIHTLDHPYECDEEDPE